MKMMAKNPLTQDEFADLSHFVRRSTGLYFDESKKFILDVSVNERMRALLIEDPAMYLTILKSEPTETEELVSLLSVPETYFFRDKKQFEALRDKILPELIMLKRNKHQQEKPRVRILSCGCSSGEEPYSIAIAMLQSGFIDQAEIEIVAFDINNNLIERARRAEYPKHSFREDDTCFLDAYFDVRGNRFILQDRVKELVQFVQANVFDAKEMDLIFNDVDIIFFRNVTIYFNREDVKRAINIIAGKLSKDGYLFLGFSETLFQMDDRFEVERIGGAYVWRQKGKAKNKESSGIGDLQEIKRELFSPPAASGKDTRPVTPQTIREDAAEKTRTERQEKISAESAAVESHYEDAVGYAVIKMFDKAEREFKEKLKIAPRHTGSLLGLAQIYADSGKDDLAISTCRHAIAIDNLLTEAYFIAGLVHYKRSEFSEAVSNFRKAVYSDAGHFTAQFYLGQAYRELGETRKSEKQFRLTLEAIEKLEPDALAHKVSGCSGSYILSQCLDSIS